MPLPGTQTELVRLGAYEVPADVVAAMDATAARKTEEAVHYRQLLDKAADQPGDVRAVYLDGAIVADKEATAYREHCSCVYAAVVYAAPAGLRAVAPVRRPAPSTRSPTCAASTGRCSCRRCRSSHRSRARSRRPHRPEAISLRPVGQLMQGMGAQVWSE